MHAVGANKERGRYLDLQCILRAVHGSIDFNCAARYHNIEVDAMLCHFLPSDPAISRRACQPGWPEEPILRHTLILSPFSDENVWTWVRGKSKAPSRAEVRLRKAVQGDRLRMLA